MNRKAELDLLRTGDLVSRIWQTRAYETERKKPQPAHVPRPVPSEFVGPEVYHFFTDCPGQDTFGGRIWWDYSVNCPECIERMVAMGLRKEQEPEVDPFENYDHKAKERGREWP